MPILQSLGPWAWWIVACVLLILELMAPGVFFIWLAIAAAIVALLDLAVALPWQGELAVFAIASLVSVAAGRAVLKRRDGSDTPHLNRRTEGYVGRRYVLAQPIVNGTGRLTIEDTTWDISGPDLPAGSTVTVTSSEGMRLRVEKA